MSTPAPVQAVSDRAALENVAQRLLLSIRQRRRPPAPIAFQQTGDGNVEWAGGKLLSYIQNIDQIS